MRTSRPRSQPNESAAYAGRMSAPPTWRVPRPLPLPIQTHRLVLRPFAASDAPALWTAVETSRDTLHPWVPWARVGYRTLEDAEARVAASSRHLEEEVPTQISLGIFDLRDGSLVGGIGLHRLEIASASAEAGYWLRKERRGEGLCGEALAAVVDASFGALGLRRLSLVCSAGNGASLRVAQRLGFRLEAVAREAHWMDEHGWQDAWTFALLAREWDAALAHARTQRAGAKGFGAVDPRIASYVARLLEPEDAVLLEIRERSAAAGLPSIAVGPFDGRHLEVLARVAGARRIVEIGTLGGYSGVCLARALPPDGRLHTLELDPDRAALARESFRLAGLAERTTVHVGPALESLARLGGEGPFDLVFIDADKASYPAYLAWAADNLRLGGTVLADNVFRRAAFAIAEEDPAPARGIQAFNAALAQSGRFRATMLPLEDGLAVGVRVK